MKVILICLELHYLRDLLIIEDGVQTYVAMMSMKLFVLC